MDQGGDRGDKRPRKFEPGWKPRRGGKKAKKQQLLAEAFVAKQVAAKAANTDPSAFVVVRVEKEAEEFPTFGVNRFPVFQVHLQVVQGFQLQSHPQRSQACESIEWI